MVQITRPNIPQQGTGTQLSGSVDTGVSSIGQQIISAGRQVGSLQTGTAYQQLGLQISQQASRNISLIENEIEDSLYRKAVNDADLALLKGLDDRSRKIVDDNGNPTYNTLVKDSAGITDQVRTTIGNTIPNSNARRRFNEYMDRKKVDAQLSAMKASRSQHIAFQKQQFIKYRDNRVTAAHLSEDTRNRELILNELKEGYSDQVKTGVLTPNQAQNGFEADKRQIRVRFWKERIKDSPEESLKALEEGDPGNLDLSVQDHDALEDVARRAVKAQAKLRKDHEKALEQESKTLFKSAENYLEKGLNPPDNLINGLLNISSQSPNLLRQAQQIQRKAAVVEEFARLDGPQRDREVKNLSEVADTPEKLDLLETLKEANKNIDNALDSDPVNFAAQQDMFDDLPFFDPSQNIAEQLKERDTVRNLIKARYDIDTSGLLASEREELVKDLNSKSPVDQAESIGEIFTVLDSTQSEALLREINDSGAKPLALAGAHAAEGRRHIASNLLEGIDIIKSKDITLPKSKDIQAKLSDFPQYAHRDMAKDTLLSVQALYAKYALQAGVFSDVVDEDILERAVMESTNGGVISYNGIAIEPPVYGMQEDEFEDFIDEISLEEIEQLGGFMDVSRPATEILKDARFVSAGTGQYYIYPSDEDEVRIIRDKTGNLFILDYDAIKELRGR